ncbi:MAG: hypothetical protein R8M45_07785, partial [Ghiorsea sp.]
MGATIGEQRDASKRHKKALPPQAALATLPCMKPISDKDTLPSIDGEGGYQKTLTILSKQNKPSKVLCVLMNMLESYRQSRKMGWSRAWTKYGLTTFQSFQLDSEHDAFLSKLA